MSRLTLTRTLLGATALTFSMGLTLAHAAQGTDQKINDPRDHARAANCIQSSHIGQRRDADQLGSLAAYGCATQNNEADRAEEELAENYVPVPTSPGGGNGGGNPGDGGDPGDGGNPGDGGDPGDGGEPGDGGDPTPPQAQSSSLIFAGVADLPTGEDGTPEIDSLADITIGTAGPDGTGGPALVDLRVGDGIIDNGAGEPGYLNITVLDAINGDGEGEGLTDSPLDGVLKIQNEPGIGGATPPENIDGIAEVNLGSDYDPEGFNVVHIDAFNDALAQIGHVTVGDGTFDENLTLQDGDLGSELIGIDLGPDPTNNENDNLVQVTLDNENFDALGEALGIDYVRVVNPPAEGTDPGLTNLAEIDGSPAGGLAPLVDLFRPVALEDPAPDDGEEEIPTNPSSSLVYANLNEGAPSDTPLPGTDSLASVTLGTADPNAPHPGDNNLVDARVGDGLIGDGAGGTGYLNVSVLETTGDGSPLDGVLVVDADSQPGGFTPPGGVGSLVQANLGPTLNDGDFDVVEADLENSNVGALGDALGLNDANLLTVPEADPSQYNLLALDGALEGALAPLVDVFRPASADAGPDLGTMPDVNELPGVSTIVASLPPELRGATAMQAGQAMRGPERITNGESAGEITSTNELLQDTLGGILGLLR